METIDRTAELKGKDRWTVGRLLDADSNPIKGGGYFPDYSVIKYKGKKAVVEVDCRDAIVNVRSGWHDDIIGMQWSGDYRWNHDKPCICVDDGKYNLLRPHSGTLLLAQDVRFIEEGWKRNDRMGYHTTGIDNEGNAIIITDSGTVLPVEKCNPDALSGLMEWAKHMDFPNIQAMWINKGLPCGYIRGMAYKGAKISLVSQERASELFKTHRRFTDEFNSAEWVFHDGQVMLLFRDYCQSDYD